MCGYVIHYDQTKTKYNAKYWQAEWEYRWPTPAISLSVAPDSLLITSAKEVANRVDSYAPGASTLHMACTEVG